MDIKKVKVLFVTIILNTNYSITTAQFLGLFLFIAHFRNVISRTDSQFFHGRIEME